MKQLLTIIEQLRHPDTGCPWDQKQTYSSLFPYMQEEVAELADAIKQRNNDDIKQELGDLLFQIVLYAQIAKEQQAFDFNDVVATVSEKMIRRHPHVFADTVYANEHERQQAWETIKQQERAEKQTNTSSKVSSSKQQSIKQHITATGDFFADISATLCSLQRGQQILDRASQTGFDWNNWRPIIDKVKEELDEIIAAIDNNESHTRIAEEVGDLFIASTNLARHLNVDAERATRQAGNKFARRFNQLQQKLAESNPNEKNPSLEQMEAAWQQVKQDEKRLDIHQAAYDCLMLNGVKKKRLCVDLLYAHWQEGKYQLLTHPTPVERIEIPGRPSQPQLVAPRNVPQRSLHSEKGQAALIHAIAHIEFNAINLALDAVYRFRDMPEQFYSDWLQVASEEAYHFSLLEQRLQQLGYQYGDMPAHNGLWEMTVKTDHDVLTRMALVPRVLEARGLDVTPSIMKKLEAAGDTETVAILEIILRDEINHVRIGSHWFHYCCEQRNLDADATFRQQLRQYMKGAVRGPFHYEARLQAGFSAEEMQQLEKLNKS